MARKPDVCEFCPRCGEYTYWGWYVECPKDPVGYKCKNCWQRDNARPMAKKERREYSGGSAQFVKQRGKGTGKHGKPTCNNFQQRRALRIMQHKSKTQPQTPGQPTRPVF